MAISRVVTAKGFALAPTNSAYRYTRPAAHAGQYAPHVQQIGRPRPNFPLLPHIPHVLRVYKSKDLCTLSN